MHNEPFTALQQDQHYRCRKYLLFTASLIAIYRSMQYISHLRGQRWAERETRDLNCNHKVQSLVREWQNQSAGIPQCDCRSCPDVEIMGTPFTRDKRRLCVHVYRMQVAFDRPRARSESTGKVPDRMHVSTSREKTNVFLSFFHPVEPINCLPGRKICQARQTATTWGVVILDRLLLRNLDIFGPGISGHQSFILSHRQSIWRLYF